jgi:hypothetical protein
MNSLYGRFGMDDNFSKIKVLNNEEFNKLMLTGSAINLQKIDGINQVGDEYFLVSQKPDDTEKMLNSINDNHNVNIAIASAITALSRVNMTKYKNNPLVKLYYTDTDSIFTNLNAEEMAC